MPGMDFMNDFDMFGGMDPMGNMFGNEQKSKKKSKKSKRKSKRRKSRRDDSESSSESESSSSSESSSEDEDPFGMPSFMRDMPNNFQNMQQQPPMQSEPATTSVDHVVDTVTGDVAASSDVAASG